MLGIIGWLSFLCSPANAATGINQQINYQARLLDSTGATVPDGTYNIEFKIYQDGDGCVTSGTSPCSGTLKWTETRTGSNKVTVRNGYLSVQLGEVTPFGSSVNWNQDTLWLSINIGGTSTPTWDGEMLPFRRMAATPYALNTSQLGGLTASQFLQLAPGSAQADTSTTSSVFINKTGASGNIVELQKSGSDILTIGNTGATALLNSSDSTSAFKVTSQTSGLAVLNVDTTNSRIGVNKTNPGYSLDVNGGANFSSYALAPVFDTASAVALGIGTSNATQINLNQNTVIATSKTLKVQGHSSFGNNATPDATNTTITLDDTVVPTGNSTGISSILRVNPGANDANFHSGAIIQAQTLTGNNKNFTGGFRGATVFAQHNGTGTVAQAWGGEFRVDNTATGIITDATALRIQPATNSGGGTVANATGISLQNQTVGGTTNVNLAIGGAPGTGNYSIYNTSGYQNYFAGSLSVGTTTNSYKLTVQTAGTSLGLFQSTGANKSIITIDNAAGGQQSYLGLNDAGTEKWQIGKQADNTFFIWDNAHNNNVVTIDSSGNLLLQPNAGRVAIGTSGGSGMS